MDIPYNEPGLPVNYKVLDPSANVPKYMTSGSAGFDLASIDEIVLNDDHPVLFRTGLVIGTPTDHMLFITYRSSTPRRWGVTVMNGIVDEDFSGDEDEIKLQVQRVVSNTQVVIPAGTRIAQGVFVPVSRGAFREVQTMGVSRGGWGSTG